MKFCELTELCEFGANSANLVIPANSANSANSANLVNSANSQNSLNYYYGMAIGILGISNVEQHFAWSRVVSTLVRTQLCLDSDRNGEDSCQLF